MTPVIAQFPVQTLSGSAYFDQDAEFPCAALLLDLEHALILRKHERGEVYTRIGLVSIYGCVKGYLQTLQTVVIIE